MGKRDQLPENLEALSNEAFLSRAYATLLGREPDTSYVIQHLARLRGGASRAEVWKQIASSRDQGVLNNLPATPPGVQPAGTEAAARRGGMTLNELLGLQGEALVRTAYVLFLGRDADPDGLRLYLGLLRSGVSGFSIVKALFESDEAKRAGARMAGLPEAIAEYRKAQRRSPAGWYLRHVRGVISDLPRDREIRALLYRISER